MPTFTLKSGSRIDPKRIRVKQPASIPKFGSFRNAAQHWEQFGFSIIPIVPGTKRSAVKWDPWLERLSPETVAAHWAAHPDQEVGFIVTDQFLVLDADGPESAKAIARLEEQFGIAPRLVVKTARGVHHFFRRVSGTSAKGRSYSTDSHPERIDVKTGRSLVVLPPSTGKTVLRCTVHAAHELQEVDQSFIDAVFLHNGAPVQRERLSSEGIAHEPPADLDVVIPELSAMLDVIDPDVGYDEWLKVLAAVHHETGGTDAGLELADAWSSRGKKYRGIREVGSKWASFDGYQGSPVTIATLRAMVKDLGLDWIELCAGVEPDFAVCEFQVVAPENDVAAPLEAYSLTGMSRELAKRRASQVHALGRIALMGQWTIIYGPPNSGKSLLSIWMAREKIKLGHLDARRFFYVDADDNLAGLAEKVEVAEASGFHMLAPGWRDLEAHDLVKIIRRMVSNDQCRGVVLVLDTVKRFTDPNDKRQSTAFAEEIRPFILHGGTVISLSHTNKNRGADGQLVYGGTADLLQDADCAYIIDELGVDVDEQTRTVVFRNIKSRGDVAREVAYRYSIAEGLSYPELLASVECLDATQVHAIRDSEKVRSDGLLIDIIRDSIRAGVDTRMALAATVMNQAECSRRRALAVLDQYAGDDPVRHHWTCRIGPRGARIYSLLTPDDARQEGEE